MNARGHRLVLTGASGGLGQAFARALAERSSAMVLVGRDPTRLDALREALATQRPALILETVAGDLTDVQVRQRVLAAARALPGGLDLLVNAAGINEFHAFEPQSATTIERLIAVNLLAPIQVTQLLLPLLKAAPRAQVVNVGSIFGYLGYPGFAVYCATKFGLRGFSQALRRELADTAVAVRYFAPRAVRTALNTPAIEAMNRELGTAVDAPDTVARELADFIAGNAWERKLGIAERLYVFLNNVLPAVNDRAIRGQLPVIRKHLAPGRAPALSQKE